MVAGLVLNARLLPFGFAVADVLGSRWRTRLLGAHLTTDESVAFAIRHDDPAARRSAFWVCAVALFGCWNLAVVAGAFAGRLVADTDAFGLDAAFPAVLVALVVPSLSSPRTRLAAVVGAVLAVATTPFLPPGLPVLVALLGLAAAVRRRATPSAPAVARAADPGGEPMMPLAAILVLAAGTFAFRVVGPVARHRVELPKRVEQLLSDAAVVLLVALAATSALMVGQDFAGPGPARRRARRRACSPSARAPFPVVVIAAAATTAVLRLLGVA